MVPLYPAESKKRTGLVRTPVPRSPGLRPLKIAKNEPRYVRRSDLQAKPRGKVYAAPFDVTLTDLNVFQPDVCYFSKSRYTSLTEHGADGAPDLVVEILSPGSAKHDLGVKKEIYTRTGVEEFWSVDPVKRTITVFQLSENSTTPRATLGVGKTLTTPLLPGLKIKLRDVFAD